MDERYLLSNDELKSVECILQMNAIYFPDALLGYHVDCLERITEDRDSSTYYRIKLF
jgi:hypothetical protein